MLHFFHDKSLHEVLHTVPHQSLNKSLHELYKILCVFCHRQVLPKLSCPTLFIMGQDDPLVPESLVLAIRQGDAPVLKKSKCDVYEDCGHAFAHR